MEEVCFVLVAGVECFECFVLVAGAGEAFLLGGLFFWFGGNCFCIVFFSASFSESPLSLLLLKLVAVSISSISSSCMCRYFFFPFFEGV